MYVSQPLQIFISGYVMHCTETFIFELFLDFKYYQLAKEIEPVLRWSVLLWLLPHCFSRKGRRK